MKTFDKQKGRKKKFINWLGHNLIVEAAPEPSDIVWENLSVPLE